MSVLRLMLEPAYVLHLRPYRDSSALVECLTREHGRIGVVARGARGQRSSLRAVLQPFQPLLLSGIGRGELLTLTAAEPSGSYGALSGRALYAGYYVNELLYRLLARHDAHPGLFDDYCQVLGDVAVPTQASRALRRFERRLLDAIGYGLRLEHDVEGMPVRPGRRYDYDPERGPVPLPESVVAQGYDGALLLGLADDRFDSREDQRAAQRLLQACLERQLGGRPLLSRTWFGTRAP